MQTTSKPLEQTLKNIGFTDKEAKVYLALLQLGPSDAKNISTKSGIKKPTTYVILEELRQKDAVLFLPNAKKKLFAAKKPDELFEVANKKLNTAFNQLPLLNALARNSKDKAMVTYYEGKKGYAQAMMYKEDELVKAGELLSYFASAKTVSPEMLPLVDTHMTRLKKLNIKIRAFAPEQEDIRRYRETDKDNYREVKILSTDIFDAFSSISIGPSWVGFFLFEQELFVIIDNTEIAKIMRQIFEMNWNKY